MKNKDKIKIVLNDNRVITRKELFNRKEKSHKEKEKLCFEEKIKIVVKLQKIANTIRSNGEQKVVWEI